MHGIRDMHGPRRATAIGAAPSGAAPEGGRRSWALMAVLSVAQFMVILDATVVNVALPSIARSLGLAAGDVQWVVTAYVLASGGLVLLGGRAADLAGGRRVFLAGLTVFTAASLASGLAPAAGVLIAARAAQGLGAALLTPAALSVITTSYAGAQRATALGVWGALGGAGAAVGVLAGGVLTTWLGWRSVFLVNVPVGLAAGLAARHLLPRREPRRSPDRSRDRETSQKTGRGLDLRGATLAVAGLVALVYALADAPAHAWGSARTLGLLALAVVLLAAFAAAERSASRPLVPAGLWRTRSLVAGVLIMLGATGILVATFFLNSLYLQEVQGASALRTGLAFLPVALVIGAGAHLAARLLPRAGSRVLIVAGLAVMGAGALLLTGVSADSGYLTGFLPGLLVTGAGTGLVLPATAVTALSEIGAGHAGLASGLMTAAHEIGAALGVAVFSAVAVAAGGGIAAGYRHGFLLAAAVAGGLAVLAALLVPAVRPAPGTHVAVH
ncbi:MAG TPA: MFS transporter [Streptosporangiaceae bacterium]|nr:MFS transporter [Streptosporangiaceae bacterium]